MWFKKKKVDEKVEVGGIYIIHRESSPWKQNDTKAKVIEVLDGWVKYRFMDGDEVSETDQEEKTKPFLSIFKYAGKE